MLALIGFLMMFLIIYLLFKNKVLPLVSFIAIPTITAFLLGFSIEEVGDLIKTGVLDNAQTGILFIFSIIFFGIINETGMFDVIISRIIKMGGDNVIAVTIITVIVATIGHIDGSIATTFLISIPAMLPLYKKLNINPVILMCLTTASLGVMNLTPWGGHLNRVATVLNMDINLIWEPLIPVQIAGFVLSLVLAVILGRNEIKKGAGKVTLQNIATAEVKSEEENELLRPKLFWFNLALVIVTVIFLATGMMSTFVVFMLAMAIALIVNYPNVKIQDKLIKKHAGSAILVSQTLFAAGVLVGILEGTGMIDAMAIAIVNVMPEAVGPFLAHIFGILSTPFALLFCTDAYYFGILPVAAQVGQNFGIEPLSMSLAMLIGRNVALTISPLVATTLLGCGLAGVELKDHIKFSFKWLFGLSIILLIFSTIIGIIPIPV